jgi:hypothetical protein
MSLTGCQWLTPVIKTTWEAEIRKTMFQGSPDQKPLERPYLNGKKAGKNINRRMTVWVGLGKKTET